MLEINDVVLYCIVLYCIVLYCIVLYCIVLYCIVLYCIVLYCIVLCCIVLYCIVLYCIVFVLYCIVLYCIYHDYVIIIIIIINTRNNNDYNQMTVLSIAGRNSRPLLNCLVDCRIETRVFHSMAVSNNTTIPFRPYIEALSHVVTANTSY